MTDGGNGGSADPTSDDPTDVRVVVVTAGDVVAAHEANVRGSDEETVLRITPPFSARTRARLHVERPGEYDADPAPIHVPPERLLASPPAYPAPDDTEDALRADPDAAYTPGRHRRRHVAAVEDWRAAVRASIDDRATIPTQDGGHEVEVRVLD